MDDREPEEIIRALRRQNLAVEVHHNESGDYVFGEEFISREEILFNIFRCLQARHSLLLNMGHCRWIKQLEKDEEKKIKNDLEEAIRIIMKSTKGENMLNVLVNDLNYEWGLLNIENIGKKRSINSKEKENGNSLSQGIIDVRYVDLMTPGHSKFTILNRYYPGIGEELGKIFSPKEVGMDSNFFVQTVTAFLKKDENYPLHLNTKVAIERKTISDLIGSVCSKNHRLWDQLGTMKDTYQQPMLLIEGMVNWKDPYLSGILTTVLLFWKYQTIFTLGMEETALAVGHLFTKQGIGRSGRIPPAAVKKHSTPKEILWEMLQCVEGVGPKTAKKILDVIPLDDWADLDVFHLDEELKRVQGLPSRSRRLMTQVFRGGEVEE